MGLGGPVWHASVRPLHRVNEKELRRMVDKVLESVGDARVGEWQERHESMHVRRRLSASEAVLVGPVVDVRGTAEAARRIEALGEKVLRHVPAEVLAEELGIA